MALQALAQSDPAEYARIIAYANDYARSLRTGQPMSAPASERTP